jgi:hypothetical protein
MGRKVDKRVKNREASARTKNLGVASDGLENQQLRTRIRHL